MSNFRPSRIGLAGVALAILLLPGCIERSTVIKVQKNGSGMVHIRNHEQGMEISIGGKKKKAETESKLPSPEQIQEMIATMGSGVSLTSASETTNRSGWKGYELIFEFDDVNHLVIRDILTAPHDEKKDDDANSADEDANLANEAIAESADVESQSGDEDSDRPESDRPEEGYRFSMKDGELKIHAIEKATPVVEAEKSKPVGTIDPFADVKSSPPVSVSLGNQMTQIYAKVLADMRIGVFVEVEGEIASTNAMHRQDNLITLLRLDVGKLLENQDATQRLKALAEFKDSPNRRAKMQAFANEVEGFDADTQDPIVVQLR